MSAAGRYPLLKEGLREGDECTFVPVVVSKVRHLADHAWQHMSSSFQRRHPWSRARPHLYRLRAVARLGETVDSPGDGYRKVRRPVPRHVALESCSSRRTWPCSEVRRIRRRRRSRRGTPRVARAGSVAEAGTAARRALGRVATRVALLAWAAVRTGRRAARLRAVTDVVVAAIRVRVAAERARSGLAALSGEVLCPRRSPLHPPPRPASMMPSPHVGGLAGGRRCRCCRWRRRCRSTPGCRSRRPCRRAR